MKRVLLCPPTYFDVEYEINPWMHKEIQPNSQKTMAAYKNIKALFKEFKCDVYEIEQVKGLPDMVFTANFGNVKNSTFLKANFKFDQRKKEADYAEDYLATNFDFDTISLPEEIYFEGQGDLLTDGERNFFGWGKRSMIEAKPYLEDFLNGSVIDFELVDPYYYHLDTCFAPLSPSLVVINPRSFKDDGLKKIRSCFENVVEASEDDNKVIACNLVHIGKEIVIGKGITPKFKEKLSKFGYTTHEVDMAEYNKGGGSVKCCTLEF
jgi:N-dimethylarginine dimethylaminohydrolase